MLLTTAGLFASASPRSSPSHLLLTLNYGSEAAETLFPNSISAVRKKKKGGGADVLAWCAENAG